MKIAMLCCSHPVTDNRVTYNQARSLARGGHEVIVFGRSDDPAMMEREALRSVTLCPLLPPGRGLIQQVRMAVRLYRRARDWRPDVVACHEPQSAIVGLLLKRRFGTPLHFDIHESFQDTLASRMPPLIRPLVRKAAECLLKYLVRRADWVTVVSPVNQRFYAPVCPDGRIDILHNSPRMELFPPCRQDVSGPVTICHEGYLDRTRGMAQMLHALALARKSTDVRLLLIGRIAPDSQKEFERTRDALGLQDIIEDSGWWPYEEVGRVESRGQIGLVTMQPDPNPMKSLSNKLYSYMCCAQAVIAPKGSATEEIVRQWDCGVVVDTTRPEEIAQAMVSLARDVDLRKRLGANGRRAIEQHLGWHRMEQRLLDIYRQLQRR